MIALPAAAPTDEPAPSLPVSVTAATRSSSTIGSISLLPTSSVANMPSGRPLARKISSIFSATPVTFAACFSTTALPAMSAGAAARNTCQYGKFHGMIASSTPSGRNAT